LSLQQNILSQSKDFVLFSNFIGKDVQTLAAHAVQTNIFYIF